ncbi:MAG: hypothetical protein D6735_04385 [Acidobacteria bacterium]|nr:MAG: hypothetical protein D6735_04385 [Acidobacteriota bacterium]
MNEETIKKLLEIYLVSSSAIPENEDHLDDDVLSAFIEGTLSKRELKPIIAHLVKCAFCRHLTAEIIKFDSIISEEPISQTAEPTKLSETINKILSELFQIAPTPIEAFEEKKTTDQRSAIIFFDENIDNDDEVIDSDDDEFIDNDKKDK